MTGFDPPSLRAPKACASCNKKKVRCLFDGNTSVCLNCQRHQWPCFQRERKRKRPRTGDEEDPSIEITEERRQRQQLTWREHESTLTRADTSSIENTRNEPVAPYAATLEERAQVSNLSRSSNPSSSGPSLSLMALSPYFGDSTVINEDHVRSYSTGDTDGPTEDDVQLLQLQGAFELPPRAVRDGLINAFMDRCSPWMPIVERSWLEGSGSQKPSMLLLQSIFVAASLVTSAPAVSAYASTHQFYRRAKALFWSGYEKNPVVIITAVCILHWYNPESPEHVSINTSGFWRYVGVGLAHQIGLHKEPTNKREARLRRRLWWTLYARNCFVSAGQGRPLAIDIDDCDLAPLCLEDFKDSSSDGALFIAYVEISSILGHLTECYRRKSFTQHMRQNIQNRLYRWTRDLPTYLKLYRSDEVSRGSEVPSQNILAQYNFEARQLHIPYFVCLAILCRPSSRDSLSPAAVLASSFVAGIFEDFLARDEIQFLGPIFTFHLLAAGISLLSCNNVPPLGEKAMKSLQTIYLALEVLAKRWPTAKESLRALKSMADKQHSVMSSDSVDLLILSREYDPFFEQFGSGISWAWSHFMPSCSSPRTQGPTTTSLTAKIPDVPLDSFSESRPQDSSSSANEHRPPTAILDPYVDPHMAPGMADDFFYTQYQGIGGWLFKDLDWNGEVAW